MPLCTRRFLAVPLTPLHIGSGERLAPEDYYLDGGRLIRFNPHAVLRDLPQTERCLYEQSLDAGRLPEALAVLRRRARDPRYHLCQSELSPISAQELRRAVEDPRRKGEIHALPRNPYTGDVVIPGSAIKGAIRTALLNAYANPGGKEDPAVRAAVEQVRALYGDRRAERRAAQALEEAAFRMRKTKTESDPLGTLSVSDGTPPAASVRIDKPVLHRLGRDDEQTAGVQMHVERLLSRADGSDAAAFAIAISLDEGAARKRMEKNILQSMLTWQFIESACNWFFGTRLRKESERFEPVRSSSARWQSPVETGDILLRVGRFCHFDSLSVENFRQAWNAKAQRPMFEIGSTRTLCDIGTGFAPFGWLLLKRRD